MIASRLLRQGLLSAAIFSGAASAVGLGEINLHSRIGETLRADIPIISGGESLDAACFSLGPVANADLPVITSARTRLVRIGQDYRLILTNSKTIDEPIVLISLRADCGMDVHREYVLLPAPPPSAHDGEPTGEVAAPMPREVRPRRARAERLSENRMVDNESPDRPAAKPRQERAAPSAAPKAKKPLPRDTLAGVASNKDRLVLGAALDDLPPPNAGDPLAPINELDERLLKMETTLHLLNQEVDKLNTAVSLGAESRAMREKLQGMQAQQASPGPLPDIQATAPQAPARAAANNNGWLELLVGLLLGGSVSAGVAHLVSRRQDKSRSFDAPPPRIAKPRRPAKA
jgi:pilus assembly protein FimV